MTSIQPGEQFTCSALLIQRSDFKCKGRLFSGTLEVPKWLPKEMGSPPSRVISIERHHCSHVNMLSKSWDQLVTPIVKATQGVTL